MHGRISVYFQFRCSDCRNLIHDTCLIFLFCTLLNRNHMLICKCSKQAFTTVAVYITLRLSG